MYQYCAAYGNWQSTRRREKSSEVRQEYDVDSLRVVFMNCFKYSVAQALIEIVHGKIEGLSSWIAVVFKDYADSR